MTAPLPAWLEPLPDAAQMRAGDQRAIAAGTPGLELMERAGAGLAAVAGQVVPDGAIAIVCAKGGNGGDGLVAARLLREQGREVRVLLTVEPAAIGGDAGANLARLPGPAPAPFTAAALEDCAGAVDALLGTGATGAPRGAAAEAVAGLNASGLPVVACDVPSGVDASTGAADPATAIHATATATFAAAKPGLWIHPGKGLAGAVHVIDIGLGPHAGAAVGLLGSRVLAELPARGPASTKFTSGHVLVAGGSRGLTGAPCLAAMAAARAGAGYVTALVPAELQPIFETRLLEVMTRGLPDDDAAHTRAGADGALELTGRGGALVLGCGAGRGDGAVAFLREVAARAEVPLVLDADGLNAHAGDLPALAARPAPTVLTPHAGELGRLLGIDSKRIGAERLRHARDAAAAAQGVVVLKGDDTLVAAPDGRVAVSRGGAPALATAGTGDVLAGVIGAYLAAGLEAFTAACAGVQAHRAAGRRAPERFAPPAPAGVVASDVIETLPAAVAAELSR
jgi:ADP-dependent NAD(P)H-hydrate dehydratase / NAD(P)H-hydrate epimerase